MKTKLLILTFSFYPSNGVAAFRMTRFAKYLPQYDVEPYIITSKQDKLQTSISNSPFPNTYYKKTLFSSPYESPINPLRYAKKANRFAYYGNYLLRLVKDLLFSPDKHIVWSLRIIPLGYRLIKRYNISTILVTGDPFSLFITGMILKKLTGAKLILDYRDPWITNPSNIAQTFYRRWYIKRLQKMSLINADFVFAVNKEIYDELETDTSKKSIVPNGYDPQLFLVEKDVGVRDFKRFTFFYAGKLDIHTSLYNPLMMLKCFKLFRESSPDYEDSELIICGNITRDTRKIIEDKQLTGNVRFLGVIPNQDVIRIGKSVDALLISAYPAKTETIIPMKVYEYIMLRKPIININSERGLAADLLRAANSGFSCNNDKPDAVLELMKRVYHLDKERFLANINEEPMKEYNAEFQTGKLVEVIRRLSGNSKQNRLHK